MPKIVGINTKLKCHSFTYIKRSTRQCVIDAVQNESSHDNTHVPRYKHHRLHPTGHILGPALVHDRGGSCCPANVRSTDVHEEHCLGENKRLIISLAQQLGGKLTAINGIRLGFVLVEPVTPILVVLIGIRALNRPFSTVVVCLHSVDRLNGHCWAHLDNHRRWCCLYVRTVDMIRR